MIVHQKLQYGSGRNNAAPGRCVMTLRPARCTRLHVNAGGKVYLDPVQKECSAFAPATVANLGPGFDWMGCAVQASFKS